MASLPDSSITVVCNLAERAQLVPLEAERPGTLRLVSEAGIELRDGGVWLPPDSVAILAP